MKGGSSTNGSITIPPGLKSGSGGSSSCEEMAVQFRVFGPKWWYSGEAQGVRVYATTDHSHDEEMVENEEQQSGDDLFYGAFTISFHHKDVITMRVVVDPSSPFTSHHKIKFFLMTLPLCHCQLLPVVADNDVVLQRVDRVRLLLELQGGDGRAQVVVVGDNSVVLRLGYRPGGEWYADEEEEEVEEWEGEQMGGGGRRMVVRYSLLPYQRFVKHVYPASIYRGSTKPFFQEVMVLSGTTTTTTTTTTTHLPRIYDVVDGPAFIFEYVEGTSLYDCSSIFNPNSSAITTHHRLLLCCQLACAMTNLHQERILHGGLRLSNIVINHKDEANEGSGSSSTTTTTTTTTPTCRLKDYGMAIVVPPGETSVSNSIRWIGDGGGDGSCSSSSSSSSGGVGGSRDYATAPEEEDENGYYSLQSDVWRMGVIMLQLLSGVRIEGREGKQPQEGGGSFLVSQEVGVVQEMINRIDHLLARELVTSMLKFQPTSRPSAGQVRSLLQRWGYQCPCTAR